MTKDPYLNESDDLKSCYLFKTLFGIAEILPSQEPWPLVLIGTTKGFLHLIIKSNQSPPWCWH